MQSTGEVYFFYKFLPSPTTFPVDQYSNNSCVLLRLQNGTTHDTCDTTRTRVYKIASFTRVFLSSVRRLGFLAVSPRLAGTGPLSLRPCHPVLGDANIIEYNSYVRTDGRRSVSRVVPPRTALSATTVLFLSESVSSSDIPDPTPPRFADGIKYASSTTAAAETILCTRYLIFQRRNKTENVD